MSSTTSIGRGPAYGGNENHENNPEHKTMGEDVQQEPPAGNDLLGDTESGEASPGSEAAHGKPPGKG